MTKCLRTLVGGVLAAALVAGASAANAGTTTYTYDALGRLTQVVYGSGLTIAYSYDAAGNRTSKVVSGLKVVVLPLGGFVIIPIN